ncbi:MAG: heat-inducible transcriptional repressor HrcA [Gloeomargaritaceae cyanobacterium C42_A2020_066]|nr:heat-inducible transcriptional repressor HrcA [Gloeomargaritaceae cyanobacterium C42_A2020_066]
MDLTERHQAVLRAVVDHYVATAEPVGSRTLVEEYQLKVSPATIRHAMGYLEKAGLLYQPHTSAGRIPSDSGYRLYVNHLLQPSTDLTTQAQALLAGQTYTVAASVEAVLRGAARLLATLSGYIILVTVSQPTTGHLRHLQLIPVNPQRVALIAVLDGGRTESTLLDLSPTEETEPWLEEATQLLSNFLNHHLHGRPLQDLAHLDWATLNQEFAGYADLARRVIQHLQAWGQEDSGVDLLVSGLAEVLRRQPEFSQLEKLQVIMDALEGETSQVRSVLCQGSTAQQPLQVLIGTENPLAAMKACSLVSARYHQSGAPAGRIGLLGPTRMSYDRVIPLVQAAAQHLSTVLSQPA